MRPIKFFFDLPWWTGLPIFLLGTSAVLWFYPIGIIIALFGAWTFFKLMKPADLDGPGFAIVGFPLFFLSMLIPERFSFEMPMIDLLNHLSPTVTYGLRAALGLASSFIAFQSFR
jgi:hypothetical protein